MGLSLEGGVNGGGNQQEYRLRFPFFLYRAAEHLALSCRWVCALPKPSTRARQET